MPYPRENVLRKSAAGTANKEAKAELANPENNLRYRLHHVLFGYGGSGTLSGGTLVIEDGSTEAALEIPISAKGPDWFPLGWQSAANHTVVAKLTAGGTEVTASITLVYTVE